MDKKLTAKQEQAYRLVSGDHEGLSTADAAKRMKITPQAVNRLLKRAKATHPELFPLLTKQEADVKALFVAGWSYEDLADKLQISPNRVSQIIREINEKQGTVCSKPVVVLRYETWMDGQIRRKF